MNQNEAFEISGIVLNEGPFVTGGPSSPVGSDLPINTLYFQNDPSGVRIWFRENASWTQLKQRDFRDKFKLAEATPETSTNSTTNFSNKVTLTTGTLVSGKYRIGFNFKWRASNSARGINARIAVNGTSVYEFTKTVATTAETPNESGFEYFTLNSSGAITITLDFRAYLATTAFMRDAILEVWRVE